MADNQTDRSFDPEDMGPFMSWIKPEIEDAAAFIGRLVVHNSYVGPAKDKLEEGLRRLLAHGIKGGGSSLIKFKPEWFESRSSHRLAIEAKDALFNGIAKAIKEPWKPGEPGKIDYFEFRGTFNQSLRGLDCEVIQDKQNHSYHFVHCARAPHKSKKCSRVHAEQMGLSPDRRCCQGIFSEQDAKARFEQPGSLDRAMEEAGPRIANEFMDWLTGLSQGQRWDIKPWLDSIERGDHLQVIHRMLEKHQAEMREARANLDEEMLNRPPDERYDIPEEDLEMLDEAHWQEMRTWVQSSIPRKSDKFFTMESAQRYWERIKIHYHRHDEQIGEALAAVNEPTSRIRDKLQAKRDELFAKRGWSTPSQ